MDHLKKTPLFEEHKKLGGKIIDFGGWALPVQYSGIKEEHEAVRTAAGLFDVSHMGEIEVTGRDAEKFLQKLFTNDLSKMKDGKAQYTLLCNENGGTIDDLLVYKLHDEAFMLVVNAANTKKDYEWLMKHKEEGDTEITDRSSEFALLALQGPKSLEILQKLTPESLNEIPSFGFKQDVTVGDTKVLLSRTGYTGEDGFEIYARADDAVSLWNKILDAGIEEGLKPCGLGSRDTLRFEAGLPLYGQELSETISPVEAGLNFAVKINKDIDFIGKNELKKQIENGPGRMIAGIEMVERGIPRTGYKVFSEDEEVGYITTGTHSPTLKKNIGLSLIKSEYSKPGTELFVQIRNKQVKAKVVPVPFYKRKK